MRYAQLAAALLGVAAGLAVGSSALAQPVTSTFVYQGEVRETGVPSTGPVDLRFRLYDAASGGSQVGGTLQSLGTSLSAGRFSASLDFGSVFAGQSRWLEIDVKPAGAGVYSTLAPRQLLSAAPVASYALSIPAQYNTFNSSGGNAIFSTGNVGIGISSPAAGLHVTRSQGGLSFNASENLFVNDTQDFVGVNRSTRNTAAEVFGLQNTPAQTGFVGMYIASNSATGQPFYGYTTAASTGWTVMDNAGAWRVHVGGLDRLAVAANGNVGIGTGAAITAPAFPLHVLTTQQLVEHLDSSNTGGTWLTLNNSAAGRTWNLISTGSANSEGPGKFLLRDATSNAVRLAFDTAGNVGVGTTTPGVKLDVAGAIRASGGVVYPDGSTQFRGGDSSPLTVSGLPNGSTFTVTIGGTTATLWGEYRMTHFVVPTAGQYAYQSGTIAADGAVRVRRPRTADQTWQGWPALNTARTLTMVLTVPGGSTVTWSGSVYPNAINLASSGGILYEELELMFGGPGGAAPLSRSVNGAPSVSTPTSEMPGLSMLLNGNPIQNIAFIPGFLGTRVPSDAQTGQPTGTRRGPLFHVRANPFSNQILYPRFITADSQSDTAVVMANGSAIATSQGKYWTGYVLKLADDGLPIEEFEIAIDWQ